MEPIFVQSAHIGMHPDGSPVVYDPEKAAEKRKEAYANLRARLEAEGKDTSNLHITFAPELEGGYRTPKSQPNSLERTPSQDYFESKQLCAMDPKTIRDGVTSATAILIGLKALLEAGFDLNDIIRDRFSNNNKNNVQANLIDVGQKMVSSGAEPSFEQVA